jgi:hypothetical protein
MENISPLLFSSSKGLDLLAKYEKTIKESQNLSSLHTIYESIRKANSAIDVDSFVSEVASTSWGVDAKTVKEDVEALGNVLSEAYMLLGKDADEFIVSENAPLNEAVEYIASNEKSKKNLVEYGSAVKVIKENILSKKDGVNMFTESSIKDLSKKLIEEFNKNYDGKLSENEIKLIKELESGKPCEAIFNDYKGLCLSKINEVSGDGTEANTEKIKQISEQIASKTFSQDTFSNDICSMLDIINVLG